MVAYSFKKQFVEPIRAGTKCQTIRKHRKHPSRHVRVGDPIQLWCAQRTKHRFKIIEPDPVCVSVEEIRIEVFESWMEAYEADGHRYGHAFESRLARQDGFEGPDDMLAFWLKNHGVGTFEGVIIKWRTK